MVHAALPGCGGEYMEGSAGRGRGRVEYVDCAAGRAQEDVVDLWVPGRAHHSVAGAD